MKKIICTFLTIAFLLSQETEQQKVLNIRQQIDALKQKQSDEEKEFQIFISKRETFLETKRTEKRQIEKEVMELQRNVVALQLEISHYEKLIEKENLAEEELNKFVYMVTSNYNIHLQKNIPFEIERRMGTLHTLKLDIESKTITSQESITRLLAFLDNEELMGYDSQVVQTLITVSNGKTGELKSGNLLRIGRVFFAFDDGVDVRPYIKTAKGYQMGEPLPLAQRLAIRLAIDIIEGRKSPQLVTIQVPVANIQLGDNK